MFPGLDDLSYKADPAQPLPAAGDEEVDDLSVDDLSYGA